MAAKDVNANATALPNHNTTTNEDEDLLASVHQRYLMAYMPIIVFMSITTCVGLVGNFFTVIFYGVKARRTSTIVFIVALSSLDIVVCFLTFTTIADMIVNVYYKGTYLCKAMYATDHWAVVSSVLVLWVISIDRYRKICKPFGKQFRVKTALYAIFLLIGMAFGSSVPTFVNIDIVAVDITAPDGHSRVLGNYCTNSDKPELSISVTFFHIFDVAVIFTVFITFVITYGKMWIVLKRQRKQRETMIAVNKPRASKEVPSSDRIFISTTSLDKSAASANSLDTSMISINLDSPKPDPESNSGNNLDVPQFNVVQRRKPDSPSKSKASRSERNITIMMLAVSVGFVVCFTPYFVVTAYRFATPTGEQELEAWMQLMLRAPFFNSVINPIIFCVFNPQFRNYVKGMILGCKSGPVVFSE